MSAPGPTVALADLVAGIEREGRVPLEFAVLGDDWLRRAWHTMESGRDGVELLLHAGDVETARRAASELGGGFPRVFDDVLRAGGIPAALRFVRGGRAIDRLHREAGAIGGEAIRRSIAMDVAQLPCPTLAEIADALARADLPRAP